MGINVKASGPSMMGQKVAAEVAKAQLLHSKGGALAKPPLVCPGLLLQPIIAQHLIHFFCPSLLFTSKTPSNLGF